jgi:hypothetical protein
MSGPFDSRAEAAFARVGAKMERCDPGGNGQGRFLDRGEQKPDDVC